MSMLSAQCDELRERATTLRQGRWSDGEDDATMMEQAADTILELRDDLQRANDATRDAEHDESMVWDRVRKAEAENTKLRELLKNALTYIEYEGCGVECPETGHGATLTSCDICNRYETESCAYVIAQSARELGIETEAY